MEYLDEWSNTEYKEEEEEDGLNLIGYVEDIFNDIDSVYKNIYKIGKNGAVILKHSPNLNCNLNKSLKNYMCNSDEDNNFICTNAKTSSDIVCGISDFLNPMKTFEKLQKLNPFQSGGIYKFKPRYFKNIEQDYKIKSLPKNNFNVKLKKRI